MDIADAVPKLAALAQETRLAVFRLLVQQGPSGLAAGEIGARLEIHASTLSFHLAQLERAGLLRSRRQQRQIFYTANFAGMRNLLSFLTEDCCQGRPEICAPIVEMLADFRASTRVDDGEAMMSDKTYSALFLCTGNSARSIMAEAILNRAGQGRFKAFSAGSHPTGRVHPYALDLLSRANYPTAGLSSKSWDVFAQAGAPSLDFVFTVCDTAASEACPVWPGQPMSAHWGVPDPAAFEGGEAETRAVFADVFRMLNTRIDIFLSLPIASLDRIVLQRRLEEIGHTAPQGDLTAADGAGT